MRLKIGDKVKRIGGMTFACTNQEIGRIVGF